MAGRPQISIEERDRIGHQVIAARATGIAWKRLERDHGRSRQQLERYAMIVLGGGNGGKETAS